MKNFKKLAMILMSMLLVVALFGCGADKAAVEETPAEEVPAEDAAVETPEEAPAEDAAEAEFPEVMSYEEFAAAEMDSPVTVETFVQAKQGWWEKDGQGVITLYTQNEDGAYFIYNAACSEEDSEKLVPGTKIVVKGYKGEWSGEVEIMDATFEIVEGSYIAEPVDATAFTAEELLAHQNQFVSFTDAVVEDKGEGAAFMYNYDGSGSQGDDLYFDVTINGEKYTFVVESYLCGADSDVYKAVEALQVGDTIDLQGFMYWYEGAQLHTTSVTVK